MHHRVLWGKAVLNRPSVLPPGYSQARPLRMQELQPSARRNWVEVQSEGIGILNYQAMGWMGHDPIMDELTYGGEADLKIVCQYECLLACRSVATGIARKNERQLWQFVNRQGCLSGDS